MYVNIEGYVWRAHPRSRGENEMVGHLIGIGKGSSPLTRGKNIGVFFLSWRNRLIPAHAGKTRTAPPMRERGRAHPRSRGENQPNESYEASVTGSSPLTRGKQRGRVRGCARAGLIPAHAGKTSGGRVGQRGRRAHPRSRGENRDEHVGALPGLGSSPLTRGKPGAKTSPPPGPGLIPAHAGKTSG